MTYPTFHNLIGGEWLPAASGKTILNVNPADHVRHRRRLPILRR